MSRVCEGVQHAHQKGVVHRDLKPGNLLVDDVDGRALPKIIDFGIDTASSMAEGREVAGTPDYMSPEQARSEEHTTELQSLMRISYAVFRLKKKKQTNKRKTNE